MAALPRFSEGVFRGVNVRLWHKADIDFDAEHVCFRG